MTIKERYDFDSLRNEAEDLVVSEIEKQIPAHPDLCA